MIDTNVVVSAVISGRRSASRLVLLLALEGTIAALYNAHVMAEYVEVLSRPELALDPVRVQVVLRRLRRVGRRVARHARPVPIPVGALPDEGDRSFMQLALNGKATTIITHNVRHFPAACGVPVATPGDTIRALRLLGVV